MYAPSQTNKYIYGCGVSCQTGSIAYNSVTYTVTVMGLCSTNYCSTFSDLACGGTSLIFGKEKFLAQALMTIFSLISIYTKLV